MEIQFDEKKCIHNGQCVGRLPAVFLVKDGQLVIDKNGAPWDEIKEVVNGCPSGALTLE